MIFYVASSLEKAEAFIKPISIMGDAWWTIQEFILDNPDHDDGYIGEPFHYGNKGRLIKNFSKRYKSAIKTFEKEYPKGDKT